ncbi:hypothetical protein [Ideonella sp. B508-1]|uniref:hypothetical protein n=1 Tax=Ideonella sp. B508-1 TaxID=137716 RepID=UPI0003B3D7B2|nr:hypothetical protein [Ideonella sp. B508-1]
MSGLQMLFSVSVWAAMCVWWFWEYIHAITHRREGEAFGQAIERASQERALNKQAKARMFGGPVLTAMVSIASTVLTLLALLWILQGKTIGALLLSFLVAGLVVNRRMDMSKHKSWARLSAIDRLRFRLTHAWLWPLHQYGNKRGENSNND